MRQNREETSQIASTRRPIPFAHDVGVLVYAERGNVKVGDGPCEMKGCEKVTFLLFSPLKCNLC